MQKIEQSVTIEYVSSRLKKKIAKVRVLAEVSTNLLHTVCLF